MAGGRIAWRKATGHIVTWMRAQGCQTLALNISRFHIGSAALYGSAVLLSLSGFASGQRGLVFIHGATLTRPIGRAAGAERGSNILWACSWKCDGEPLHNGAQEGS